jgi:hypothetical protein
MRILIKMPMLAPYVARPPRSFRLEIGSRFTVSVKCGSRSLSRPDPVRVGLTEPTF